MYTNPILEKAEKLYCLHVYDLFAEAMVNQIVVKVSKPFVSSGYVCAEIHLSNGLEYGVYYEKVETECENKLEEYSHYLKENVENQIIQAIIVGPDDEILSLIIYTDTGYVKLALGFDINQGFIKNGILDRNLSLEEKNLMKGCFSKLNK
ncbi:hypothetical protein BKK44_10240 [Bacillus cereus]|nr:hypothetical protein BKK44_10240 [Bacillus cereus]